MQLIGDLERWGLADCHDIRSGKMTALSVEGRTEDCLKLLDESAAKGDPFRIELAQLAM